MGQQHSVAPKTYDVEYQRPSSRSTVEEETSEIENGNYLGEDEALLNLSTSSDINRLNQHSFKKVIVRSRFCDNDGNELSTVQPVMAQPQKTVNTNGLIAESSSFNKIDNNRKIDITSKVKGFSNEEYQRSLQNKLNSLYGTNKLISNDDAKCLVLLLQQKSDETLLKTLTTMCNLAAFTINQVNVACKSDLQYAHNGIL